MSQQIIKNTVLVGLFLMFSFSACQNAEKQQSIEEIAGLEQAYAKQPNSGNFTALIARYNEFLQAHPEDQENNPRFLYRMAAAYYQKRDASNALIFLERGLKEYEHQEATPRSLMLKGTIHQENQRQTQAIIAYGELIRRFPNHPDAENARNAIPKVDVLENQIANFEKTLEDSTSGSLMNTSIFPQLANAYLQIVAIQPNADNSPERLYDAGKYFGAVRDFNRSISTWEQLITDYPDSEFAKNALFQQAFFYENFLNDLNNAKRCYETFLEKYPKDDMATSAKFSLDNLGKSADEIYENVIKNKQ